MNKVLWLLIFALIIYGYLELYAKCLEDKELWNNETKCIAMFISQGIERRDIEHSNGECWIKGITNEPK